MLSIRDTPQNKRSIQAENEGIENSKRIDLDLKKAGLTILRSDKIDFKTKDITRGKEGHYMILKGVVQ